MGTSKSYSGSGGKAAKNIQRDVHDWLEQLPPAPDSPENPQDAVPALEPNSLLNVIALIRPRSKGGSGGDGPGGGARGVADATTGGRSGGGARRSVARTASTAGRAAAAAYAFRVGDRVTLERLGLDFSELEALGNPIEVARRIVDAACGPRSDSTIEETEQRLVAAEVAEWVLVQEVEGYVPTPEEITRHALAVIIADAYLTESGGLISTHDRAELAEQQIRDAAEALAARANLSLNGVSEDEFARAVEQGIEDLRRIHSGGS